MPKGKSANPKVIYNAAVGGGLHLSDEAVAWLKERGMDVEAFPVVRGKVPGGYGPFWEIPRHASLLVACIEALGQKAKGLEADHVIILDCNGGRYGFPSQVEDDPIMQYVLSGADSFESAEERRLFYVAITRAKKSAYCLYDEKNPSEFVAEFPEFRRNIL